MTHFSREEEPPECSLFSVPLIAAGAASDALCCQGPRRDFAAEMDFRMANAARMYPAGYAFVPSYVGGYRSHYGGHAPVYMQYSPASQVRENLTRFQTPRAVDPLCYPSYSVGPPPQQQSWAYNCDPVENISLRPTALHADLPLGEQLRGDWGGPQTGRSISPVEQFEAPSQYGLSSISPQQITAIHGEAVTTVWPRTVEVPEVLPVDAQKKDDLVKPEAKDEGDSLQQSHSKESQTELKVNQLKTAKEGKGTPRGTVAKRKTAVKKGSRGPEKSQFAGQDDAGLGDTVPELTKSESVENALEPSQSELEKPANAEHGDHSDVEERKLDNEGASGDAAARGDEQETKHKLAEDTPRQDAEAKEPLTPSTAEPFMTEDKSFKRTNKTFQDKLEIASPRCEKARNADVYAMTMSAPPAVGVGLTLPLSQKFSGNHSPELLSERCEHANGKNWPVGYVPPPDDKYRELVLGNQVYLEGGTFYLSETGAYLLGLRD
ncbi:hypothetical protein, conserved [Eimeria necatrix]|uniref:Uncharacterized protein n=1 Tax=Eimeria necatrix TaxID=51315 RepID=U6MWU2_9EIME|nr:hypothetical protein, conserved [Eimeria necatrix]CDJ68717.1 hypothetical protein, conserved [Eimeria necatrix]